MSEAFDESRELCDDGNCLGVKVDGRCIVCGAGGQASAEPAEPAVALSAAEVDEFDDDERQLCPDGACTGLLGSDSKCKVCGRTSSDSAAS